MKALTGSDKVNRVTKKRFRKMTPEELEKAQDVEELLEQVCNG